MKGLFLFVVLFFAFCSSATVYITSYNSPNCASSTYSVVNELTLTNGNCLSISSSNSSFMLSGNNTVSYYSTGNCSGTPFAVLSSSGACVNGTFGSFLSFSQSVASGAYIEFDSYNDNNCTNVTNPYKNYITPGSCEALGQVSILYTLNHNNTATFVNYLSQNCTGAVAHQVLLSAGCAPIATSGNSSYFNVVTLGSSVTGSSVTGSSVTGSSVTGSSVTGSSVTGSSVTGSSITAESTTEEYITGSITAESTTEESTTEGSNPASDSNLFYPSLFLLVISFFFSLF